MSETIPTRRIRAQSVPHEPRLMRFILDAPVQAGVSARFDAAADAPLARALFAVPGVTGAQVSAETVLVTCAPGSDWQALKAPVAAAIRQALDASDRPLGAGPDAGQRAAADAAMLAAVSEILDRKANPSIASHGGKVSAEHVADGVVHLRMSGGCQGCAASALTLRNGVETMLRAAIPGIRGIVDVTDHAAGTNPYYQGAPGQSPVFSRPLPEGALTLEDGQLVIDPDYLAPRLGLTPETLQSGLARGTVIMDSEGRAGERMTVTVRSRDRIWAAELFPDGHANEVPPPWNAANEARSASLADRVRHHLQSLPPGQPPLTYGQLARALGMYLPGSVRKVTAALETTMRQDARAGRPLIAARVVGRGSGVPGKGFFDLTRELGLGPEAGESDLACHQRLLAQLQAA